MTPAKYMNSKPVADKGKGTVASASKDTSASIRHLLSAEQMRKFRRLSPLYTWLALGGIWGSIASAVALFALWPHPLTFLLAVVVIGSRQFALAVMMHEASHGLLFSSRRLNDWVGQWLCAYPILQDTAPYRPYHATHHRYTETDQDPDLVFSRVWPTSRASFTRKILRDITGIAGIRRYYNTLKSTSGKPSWPWHRRITHMLFRLRGFLPTNVLLLGLFAATTHWSWYLLLWWVPMLTWYSLMYRLRNIAEHALVPATDDFSVARTTLSPWLLRWVIAPLNVNYHAEHHLMPNCPWYRLPALHKVLRAKLQQSGEEHRLCTSPGYFSVLNRVVVPA